MRTIELWRWRVRGLNGRQHVTRYAMTEAEALQRDPEAVRVEGTLEIREVPENAAEVARLMPGHTMRSGLVRRLSWWRQPEAWSAERR
jgi:hypothetical protein